MAWRISHDEFLIRGRSYPIALSLSVNRVTLPDGTRINSASEYFRVSARGHVRQQYSGPSSSTLEDCLYVINIHVVIQSALVECFWTERYGHAGVLEEKIRLPHLEPLSHENLPFDAARIVDEFHRS